MNVKSHGILKLTNDQHSHTDIQVLKVDRKHSKDQQDIADVFRNYFWSVIEKKNKNNKSKNLITKRFIIFNTT
jgi:hypothetical protein